MRSYLKELPQNNGPIEESYFLSSRTLYSLTADLQRLLEADGFHNRLWRLCNKMNKIIQNHIINEHSVDIYDEFTYDNFSNLSKDSALQFGILFLDQLSESIIERSQVWIEISFNVSPYN